MISECDIRKRIGLNDTYLRRTLRQCVARSIISSQTNIELALIVFHAFFSGVIKTWLMDSNSFNLYKQAPALVDNILATLNITRVAPVFYDTASSLHTGW